MAKNDKKQEPTLVKKLSRPSDINEVEFIKMICISNPYILESVRQRIIDFYAIRGKDLPKF